MRSSYALTPMQRTMLMQSIVGGAAGNYLLQMTGSLEEELVPDTFAAAWQQIVNRHDALRASFDWERADDPRQTFAARVGVPFQYIDLSETDPSEHEPMWDAFLSEDRAQGFDIENPPLMRVTLVRLGKKSFRFSWTVHHALVDGRSLVIVLDEVFAVYSALTRGAALDLTPAPSFQNYLRWLAEQDFEEHEEFFRESLAGISAPRSLVFESAREGVRRPSEVNGELSADKMAQLQRFASDHGVTIHTLVQAAWCAVLVRSQTPGEQEVVFGATRAGRFVPVEGADAMVGLLINTLPLRAQVTETTSVHDLASALRDQTVELRSHEHVPLCEISRWLGINGTPFKSMIVAENFEFDSFFHAAGDEWKQRSFSLRERSDGLSLGTRIGDRLHLALEFDEVRLSREAAQWMVDHLCDLLAGVPGPAERSILSLAEPGPVYARLLGVDEDARAKARPLSDEERATILVEWNATDVEFPTDQLVHERIAAHAATTPDALAISDPDGHITYGELDRRANRVAHHLQSLGVGPDVRVAVCMESSRELLVSYLGILRAGGAYVPVDPGYPSDRLEFVCRDSEAQAILTRPQFAERFKGATCPVLAVELGDEFLADMPETAPETEVGPQNLVYVIYTSGSTGTPKGVLIEHRNLTNIAGVYGHRLGITENDRAALIAGVAFDAAVVDIWPYLVRGASLHVPASATRVDQRMLVPWLIDQEIDVVFLPTALGEAAFQEDWSGSERLRAVLVGGDKLHGAPARKMPFTLYNTYGPTECTVDSTWFTVPTGVVDAEAPPIGRPIENYRAYVVDDEMNPLPVGTKGELLIGGAGVARGYLNRDDLSAEKFLPDPFREELDARVYRTGDLVCHRPDGEIEFHGRIDDQVQIRGFRVEPGEVAVALNECEDVEAVAVIAREDRPGKVRLVAYFVSTKQAGEIVPALRAFAEDRLPAYMVPSFVALDELPMTLNGKVDRKALRPPEEYAGWRGETGGSEPVDDVERKLVEIWRTILELDEVGTTESFFDLGGDSLSVITLLAAAETEFGCEIQVPDLLRDPTIRSIGRIVRGEGTPDSRPVVVTLQGEGERAPFFCVAGAGGGCHWFGELAKELRDDRPFLGLEPTGPGGDQHTIAAIASGLVEEVKRIQPAGPYYVGGYSTGGVVAYEMAQQMRAAGDEIGLLALIEADGGRDFSTRAGQLMTFARNLARMDPGKAARIVLDRAAYALGAVRHRLGQANDTKVVAAKIDARKHEDEEALHAYVAEPYAGDVRIFACEERPMTAVVDEAYGWGELVEGIIVSTVPGDHYTILGLPNVRVLASDLQDALDMAEAERRKQIRADAEPAASSQNR